VVLDVRLELLGVLVLRLAELGGTTGVTPNRTWATSALWDGRGRRLNGVNMVGLSKDTGASS